MAPRPPNSSASYLLKHIAGAGRGLVERVKEGPKSHFLRGMLKQAVLWQAHIRPVIYFGGALYFLYQGKVFIRGSRVVYNRLTYAGFDMEMNTYMTAHSPEESQ